jgi:hypothetical protein
MPLREAVETRGFFACQWKGKGNPLFLKAKEGRKFFYESIQTHGLRPQNKLGNGRGERRIRILFKEGNGNS